MYNQIPAPESLPVHWLWFQVLLVVTFLLHLILMNLVLGGSLLAIWDNLIKKRKISSYSNLPVLLALAINLGVPPLLFVQVLYGHLFYSSSIIMALPWILVIPVLIIAYYSSYIYIKKSDTSPGFARGGLVVSSVLLLYIAFMYVNNSTMAINPSGWSIYHEKPGGSSLNFGEPSLWPRYLHFIIAALSVASLGIAVYTKFKSSDPDTDQVSIKLNMRRFAWLTLIQAGIGIWFWLSNPKEVWMTFMGGSITATIILMLGILMTASMILSAFRNKINATLVHLLVIMLLMIIVREFLRAAWLKDIFHPGSLEVVNKISPLIAFLLVFAIGLYLLYYMYRLATEKTEKS
ncbi:MAG: hypothetical protein V2I37_09965 [Marinilabiliaceae bacterium]|jgi:hypothetical protein|nr:hypothetical protein [Marinilabiliaceae bacterium]